MTTNLTGLMDYAVASDCDGADKVKPHADAAPWTKACPDCAFRISDPQELGVSYQQRLRTAPPGQAFFCIHRLDGGYHRACACFAAIQRTAARTRNLTGLILLIASFAIGFMAAVPG